MRFRTPAVIVLSLLLAGAGSAAADTRSENIDMFVLLDRSLSMDRRVNGVKKIEAVTSYAASDLIDGQLILGDFLEVIAFYGKTETVVSRVIATEEDRAAARQAVRSLAATGRFTDIGSALDTLRTAVERREGNGRLKHVLLITDGIQEAPPTSRYYSPDGSFNHAFLQNAKTIQQKGWKIQLLGLGPGTAVLDLARELEAAYGELSDDVSAREVARQTETLLGTIRLVEGSAAVAPVGADGRTTLTLSVRSEGYSREVTMSLAGIAASSGTLAVAQALAGAPAALEVSAEGDTPVTLPLVLPAGLPAGSRPWKLAFSFDPGERFTPGEVVLEIRVRGWIGNHPLAFALILAGAALVVVVLVLLALRLARGRPVRFAVTVDGRGVEGSPVGLVHGAVRFLAERDGVFSLEPRRTARAIARFTPRRPSNGRPSLAMEFLKPDRFWKTGEPPANALGSSCTVKASDGSRHALKVSAKER